jgi:hypothetical protein
MQKAMGGRNKIASYRDLEQFERADTWFEDGRPRGVVRKRMRFIRPNYLRLDQVGPGDTYVLYFNGKSGWEILPDGKYAELAGGELRFAEGYLNAMNHDSWMIEHESEMVFTSPAPNVIAITSKDDPTHITKITLDPVTFLPIKKTGISLADPDHPVASETRVEEWQTVEGITFPKRFINIHNGKKLAEITVESIRLNCGLIGEDLAKKPADLKPEMSR